MSTWYAQDLTCPGCGAVFTATLARGLHASRAPLVRDQILRGELHQPSCPGCCAGVEVQRSVAYTDVRRRQWVHVARPDDLGRWAAVEAAELARVDLVVRRGAPLVAPLADELQVRVVFDLDELRERLVVWDRGLDDGVVECVKLRCLRARPGLAPPGHRIRLRSIAADGALVLAAVRAATPRRDVRRWIVPAAVVHAVAADVARWRAGLPELFTAGFVSIDRYRCGGDLQAPLSAAADAATVAP